MVKMFIVRKDLIIITGADVNGLTNRIPALMKTADAEYPRVAFASNQILQPGHRVSLIKQRTCGVMQICEKKYESFVNLNFGSVVEKTTNLLIVVKRQSRRIAIYQLSTY